jgi:putative hydrolase of the HAD superfamily
MKSKRLILFIDSGDTLVNEDTEIRDAEGFVIKSELIDGAEEALRLIHDQGYTVALVADGEARSFDNIYKQNNLEDCFDTRDISGT